MLKVGIVGCGKIADAHAAQIRRIPGCEIVGVSDRELLMARQLCDRFSIKNQYRELSEMLQGVRPDVVHISTPPASHYELGKYCLEHGTHVYIEKPFTTDAGEAERLIALANTKGLKITVGHDDQYSHVARRMRRLVNAGYLGGPPVHMESHYCYDLTAPGYARALLGDKAHWVRRLPGKLLHNVISHGIARLAEFLTSDEPTVIAHGFVSPALQRLGEREIVDELRVIISDGERLTAYFTFSSQMRPSLHQFRIYGPKNGLALDQDQEALLTLPGERSKSYIEKFLPHASMAVQHFGNLATNVRLFLGADLHMKSGMKHLIELFYDSVTSGGPPPIEYRQIVLTAKIMDSIFEQLSASSHADPVFTQSTKALRPALGYSPQS